MQNLQDRDDLVRPGSSDFAVHRARLTDVRQIALQISQLSVVTTQTAPGDVSGILISVSAGDLVVARADIDLPTVDVNLLDPGYAGFFVPIAWSGTLACNGVEASSDTLFAVTQGHLVARARRRDVVFVALPMAELVRNLSGLSGVGPEDVTVAEGPLTLAPAALDRCRGLLAHILDPDLPPSPHPDDREHARTITERALMAVLGAYLAARPARPWRAPVQPSRIVRRAVDRFMETPSRTVSLADLCVATGVGATTLHCAFRSVTGLSPLRYIKLKRLTDARATLLRARPERGSIKRAAIDAGLNELGRFSVDYRSLFGETPSATLARHPVSEEQPGW